MGGERSCIIPAKIRRESVGGIRVPGRPILFLVEGRPDEKFNLGLFMKLSVKPIGATPRHQQRGILVE